jgi:pimeloyl-ACP methyl ester carboxylesterase
VLTLPTSDWRPAEVHLGHRIVSYHRTGGALPVLVLLHGLADDGLCWTRVVRELEDDFDIVMPDARGHGRSAPLGHDPFALNDLADDVAGLLDHLEIRGASVFGHSMGAITASFLAGRRPDLVGRLVLEDPPLDVPVVDAFERRASLASDIEPWRRLAPADRYPVARSQHPAWEEIEIRPWVDSKVVVDLAVLDHLDVFDHVDWRSALRNHATVPGLLLIGEPALGALVTDRVAAEVGAVWSSGTVVRIPGAGHCIHRDRWEATMGAVAELLGGLARSS